MPAPVDTFVVTREIEIDASPETVWELLTDPEKITRWKGVHAEFDSRDGGSYRIEVIPGRTAAGTIVELDPPRKLVYTWGWEGQPELPPGASTVEFLLEPTENGTKLTFLHHKLPGLDAANSHGHGWDHYFERLVVVAKGGDPGPDPWASERSE